MSAFAMALAFEGHAVRVLGTPEAPEWVAADVCECLGIVNPRDVLSRVPEDEKGVGETDTPGGRQAILTLLESGLYRVVFRSNKPEAERFRRWVFGEVLPAIRRTGAYSAPGLAAVLARLAALEMRLSDREINDALIAQRHDAARSSLASGLSNLGRAKLVQDASAAQVAEGQRLLIEGSEPTQVPTGRSGRSKRRARLDEVAGLLALVDSFALALERADWGVTARELLDARGTNPLVSGMSPQSLGNIFGRLQGASFGGLVLMGEGRRPKRWRVVRAKPPVVALSGEGVIVKGEYRTLTGRRFDLDALSVDERRFLDELTSVYRTRPDWNDFAQTWIKLARERIWKGQRVPVGAPVYRICQDMEARLGVAEGRVAAPDYRDRGHGDS